MFSVVADARLMLIRKLLHSYQVATQVPVVVGVHGVLATPFLQLYSQYDRLAMWLPRTAFTDHCWDQLGHSAPESYPSEVLARRLGLTEVGFKKTDGGPVFLGSLVHHG